MNYWLINPKFDGTETDLSESSTDCVYMGWWKDKCPDFYNSVKAGDFIIVVDGSHKNNRCHYIGIADWLNEDDKCWFLKYSTKLFNNQVSEIIRKSPADFGGGNSPNPWGPTKSIIKLGNNPSELEIKALLSKKFEKIKMNEKISEIVALLRKKKNIILQGAPGTGKTYTTAEIALSILGKDITQYETHEDLMKDYENLLIKIDDSGIITSGQIGFVTFHQSMDYEDFVEGIKPKTEGDGNVTYDVEDGIFKVISNKAKYRKYRSFSDAYTNFINDIRDKYSDKNPLKIKTRTDSYFAVTVNSNNNLTLYTGENFSKQGSLTKENILKQINGEEKYKGWDSYFCGVIDYLSSKYGYKDEQESQMPYVLIIDEINRGNVSKIFGELITLLEADKRTEGNHPLSVTLPYSKEKFEIPSNLYIIGTMNTTDRSVGNIDYAVRRRFSFVTLESERSVVLAKNNGDEKSLAVQLFDSVMKFLTKNRNDMDIDDLMVGHSYFLADDENELKIKWKYDILPLLREYCKDGITKKDVDKNCSIQDFINSQNEQN